MFAKAKKFNISLLSFFLVSLYVFSAFALNFRANAAGSVSYTVSSASGAAGDIVAVTVSISPNSEVGAMTFDLSYDKSKLSVVEAKEVKGTGGSVAVNKDHANGIRFVLVHATGLSYGGTLLTVEFKILAGWSGNTDLKLKVSENAHFETYKEIPYTVKNGKVSVIGGPATTESSQPTSTTKPSTTVTTRPGSTIGTTVGTTKPQQTQKEPDITQWITVPDSIIDDIFSSTTRPSKQETTNKDIPGRTGLSDEEKELVLDHFSKESIPVSIGDDGSIYIPATTEPKDSTESELAGDEISNGTTGKTDTDTVTKTPSKAKIVIAIILAIVSIIASLFAIIVNLKKRRK